MVTDFRLRVFVVVAQYLSFTRAATVLNISQPAITKHIKELEKSVGESLFSRRGSSIELTDKGKQLLPYVYNILESYEALNENMSQNLRTFEGVLHLGASTTIAQYILPSILAKFNKEYPKIKIVLTSANSDEIIESLIDKKVELALVEGSSTNSSVHYSHLADDKIVLICANPKKKSISIDEVATLPLIVREEGSGTLSVIEKALKNSDVNRKELNITMQLGSSEAIIRYLRESNSYAFISISAVQDYLSQKIFKIVEIKDFSINREFRFATLHGKSGRLIELFKSFCSSNTI